MNDRSKPTHRPFGLHPIQIPTRDHHARRPLVPQYGLSDRDVAEFLNDRGIEVDHVTIYRLVQKFTPLLINAARPCLHIVGNRWLVDEIYVKDAGTWRYVYRPVDQNGQVIDIYFSKGRDIPAARSFFKTGLLAHDEPVEVITDLAQP